MPYRETPFESFKEASVHYPNNPHYKDGDSVREMWTSTKGTTYPRYHKVEGEVKWERRGQLWEWFIPAARPDGHGGTARKILESGFHPLAKMVETSDEDNKPIGEMCGPRRPPYLKGENIRFTPRKDLGYGVTENPSVQSWRYGIVEDFYTTEGITEEHWIYKIKCPPKEGGECEIVTVPLAKFETFPTTSKIHFT